MQTPKKQNTYAIVIVNQLTRLRRDIEDGNDDETTIDTDTALLLADVCQYLYLTSEQTLQILGAETYTTTCEEPIPYTVPEPGPAVQEWPGRWKAEKEWPFMCPECCEPLVIRNTGPGMECALCGDVWVLQKMIEITKEKTHV